MENPTDEKPLANLTYRSKQLSSLKTVSLVAWPLQKGTSENCVQRETTGVGPQRCLAALNDHSVMAARRGFTSCEPRRMAEGAAATSFQPLREASPAMPEH